MGRRYCGAHLQIPNFLAQTLVFEPLRGIQAIFEVVQLRVQALQTAARSRGRSHFRRALLALPFGLLDVHCEREARPAGHRDAVRMRDSQRVPAVDLVVRQWFFRGLVSIQGVDQSPLDGLLHLSHPLPQLLQKPHRAVEGALAAGQLAAEFVGRVTQNLKQMTA